MVFQAKRVLVFIMYILRFRNYIKWLYIVYQYSLGEMFWTICNLLGIVTKKSGGYSRAEFEILNHVTNASLLPQSLFPFF